MMLSQALQAEYLSEILAYLGDFQRRIHTYQENPYHDSKPGKGAYLALEAIHDSAEKLGIDSSSIHEDDRLTFGSNPSYRIFQYACDCIFNAFESGNVNHSMKYFFDAILQLEVRFAQYQPGKGSFWLWRGVNNG